MPSPAGKKAWGKGAIEGGRGPRGAQVEGQSLSTSPPEQHCLHQVSWRQGVRRQEAPRASNLSCGLSQVIPPLWLKDGAEWGRSRNKGSHCPRLAPVLAVHFSRSLKRGFGILASWDQDHIT